MVRALERFINHEAFGGIILMFAAVFALVLDNSPLAWLYDGLLTTPMTIAIGALELGKPLLLWINDGLMAVFFFLVGLEIKREMIAGRAVQPAAGGPARRCGASAAWLVPALIYVAVNVGRAGDLPAAGRSRRRPTSPSPSACWRCSAAACRWR